MTDAAGLLAGLEDLAARPEAGPSDRPRRQPPSLAFVYPDAGSAPAGAASWLIEAEPGFLGECERLDRIARATLGRSALDVLRDERDPAAEPDRVAEGCASLAILVGLTALWRRRGVRPDPYLPGANPRPPLSLPGSDSSQLRDLDTKTKSKSVVWPSRTTTV